VGIYIQGAKVEVRAPHGADERGIERFVRQKSAWIEAKLNQQSHKAAEIFRLEDQSEITVMGEPYTIHVTFGTKNSLDCTPGRLGFTLKDPDATAATMASLFRRWLLKRASDYMIPKTREIAARLGLSSRLKDIRFRRTRSKWGHCSSQGIIQYNWLIMLAPSSVIDYLIIHEVCHLRHMNHSPAYWAQVAVICPEHEVLRRWLKENEHRYRIVGL
jgi:predicted metal-dependent hydrolase